MTVVVEDVSEYVLAKKVDLSLFYRRNRMLKCNFPLRFKDFKDILRFDSDQSGIRH